MTEKTYKLYKYQGTTPTYTKVIYTEKMIAPPTKNMYFQGQYETLEELKEDNKDSAVLDCKKCGKEISTETDIITTTIPPVCRKCYKIQKAAEIL